MAVRSYSEKLNKDEYLKPNGVFLYISNFLNWIQKVNSLFTLLTPYGSVSV